MSTNDTQAYCAFCGLPVPKSFSLGKAKSKPESDYCCSGCRTVASVEQAQQAEGNSAQGLFRLGLAIFFTMNVMVFTMALWSQDIYPESAFASPLAISLRGIFRWASLLFSAPVLWLLGRPIISGVWQSLRHGTITSDSLILLGVSAAYTYSVVSVMRGSGHIYFEVGAMVLVFVSIGRWLEAKGKRRTGESLDMLAQLLPETVRRQQPHGEFSDTRRQEIVSGDVIRVLAGERFSVDGIILSGTAEVDQQMLTGESQPIPKTVGETVASGTLNLDGDLLIQVTAADGQETLSRFVELVRQARSKQGRYERLADRITKWFVPVVLLVALVAGWHSAAVAGLHQGILTSLAIVLIACPCALGLATPMAVWTALGRAAECGVLFRSGVVMEKLATVRFACFDKTGTLTNGKPLVHDFVTADPQDRALGVRLAERLVGGSNHPLSKAISEFAKQQSPETRESYTTEVRTIPGKGLRGNSDWGTVFLGSEAYLRELQLLWPEQLAPDLEPEAHKRVYLGWDGHVRGAFEFTESVRPEAATAIAECESLGLRLRMLTGDTAANAQPIARQFALTADAEQLPEDKATTLAELSQRGGVAMVGDGLNDAPALATADVGVALGCGADVSRDAAGVCLLSDDLRRFPWAVSLARATARTIRVNLFWAFTYNGIGIAMAATGRLNPILAAGAMVVSSLLVVGNSLRLRHFPVVPATDPSWQSAGVETGETSQLAREPVAHSQQPILPVPA